MDNNYKDKGRRRQDNDMDNDGGFDKKWTTTRMQPGTTTKELGHVDALQYLLIL